MMSQTESCNIPNNINKQGKEEIHGALLLHTVWSKAGWENEKFHIYRNKDFLHLAGSKDKIL